MAHELSLQEAFDAGFAAVKSYVDRELDALERRIEAMESGEEIHQKIDRFKRQYPELAKHNVLWPQFAAAMEISAETIKRLSARVAALEGAEKSGGVKYSGVWQRPTAYARGAFVTHRGCLWHANTDTAGVEPGSSSDWTLAVKAGRNGRDSR